LISADCLLSTHTQEATVSCLLTPKTISISTHLSKCVWSVRDEQLLGAGAAVRKREFEVLGDQLLDVRSLNVVGVGDFNDFENLSSQTNTIVSILLSATTL
jgi:hypothetical protein